MRCYAGVTIRTVTARLWNHHSEAKNLRARGYTASGPTFVRENPDYEVEVFEHYSEETDKKKLKLEMAYAERATRDAFAAKGFEIVNKDDCGSVIIAGGKKNFQRNWTREKVKKMTGLEKQLRNKIRRRSYWKHEEYQLEIIDYLKSRIAEGATEREEWPNYKNWLAGNY